MGGRLFPQRTRRPFVPNKGDEARQLPRGCGGSFGSGGARRETDRVVNALRERFDTLSSREREIMIQVTAGRLNKQIASEIGIAESTVKVHRTNLMRKMKARSLPELSRMADMLKLTPEKPPRS
jgi:DNA-binding NarL/FixJ family response regulator